ncbi:Mannosyl phosphorylinositol ceramide synthase SUR1 [Paramyrothecium foliicola]|nr:Mannosyl phosphorylinositol ceramide synthase SUR1 [Paramyrothecium foliicola]
MHIFPWRWLTGRRNKSYTKLYDEEQQGVNDKRSSSQTRRPQGPRTIHLLIIDAIIIILLVIAFWPLITLLRRNDEFFAPHVTLSDKHDVKPVKGQNHTIPFILHQTTATENIPEKWVASQRSCKKAYSHFEYKVRYHLLYQSLIIITLTLKFKLWTDASARDFLVREYPWAVSTWDNYAFPIMRADAIRYFVLYHYGGIYLDMDTVCDKALPLDALVIEQDAPNAIFKSTLPTGVTNDMMISSARHPAFLLAIQRIPGFFRITSFWARLQPYCAIMISTGPMFITLAVLNFLLQNGPEAMPMVQVVAQTELASYITDLESATWHTSDAKVLMWIGDRPWSWIALGIVPLVIGLWILNFVLRRVYRCWASREKLSCDPKLVKDA